MGCAIYDASRSENIHFTCALACTCRIMHFSWQGLILDCTLCISCFNDLSDDVICNITIYAADAIFLLLVWSDIWFAGTTRVGCWIWPRTLWTWARSGLFNFNAGLIQLVLFYQCNNSVAIGGKMSMFIFETKQFFKILRLF